MAEKRPLETVGSVKYTKLPRLEAKAGSHLLGASLCKSSALPGYPSDHLYGYKGSCFAYPLQCLEESKPLAHWPPSEAYAHCPGSPASQQLRTEKAFCPLYRQGREGLETQDHTPGKETGVKCGSQESLSAPERWASWTGYPEFSSWLHSYVAQPSPRAPGHCPNLAVPKPVYQNHVYGAEFGCAPKALGRHTEIPLKGTEWTPLGALDCMESPSYFTGGTKQATGAESSFPPGPKHSALSSAGFLPYRKAYEKCQGAQGSSFLDGSYSTVCNTQKSISEANGDSPSKHIWSKLPLAPVSPLANPASMMPPERSSAGYPLPPYPMAAHEHLPLYPQNFAQAEKMNPWFPLPACKGFGSLGCEDPQVLPGPYFPPTPGSYYPSLLDSYLYRAAGPTPRFSPSLISSREPEHQPIARGRAEMGTLPQMGCAAAEKTLYCSPLPRNRDVLRGCQEGGRVMDRRANDSFPNQRPSPKPPTSQSCPSLEKSPLSLGGFGQRPDTGCVAGFPQSEKASVGHEKGSYPSRPSPLASDPKTRHGDDPKPEAGACIVISDSPVARHDSSSKGERPNVAEDPRTPLQRTPCSPVERGRSVPKRPESPPTSSSPPMPVINNVFSLAPYREYLEGASDTVEIPLSKNGRSQEDPPKKAGESVGNCGSWQPDSIRPAEASQGPSAEEKDPSCAGMTEGSNWHPRSHSPGIRRKASPRPWQSVGLKPFPTKGAAPSWPASRGDASNRAGEMEREESALDLSCKMEGLAQVPSLQKPLEKETEAVERESPKSKREEVKEGPASRRDVLLETKWRTSELPLKSGPEGKSNFQSSAAFLFKKFKILKSHAASLGSATQQNGSLSFQLTSSEAFSPHPGPDPVSPPQDSPVIPPSPSQVVMLQNVQRSPQQAVTWPSSSPAPESPHQGVTQQTDLPAQPRPQQESTQQNNATAVPSLHQAGTDRSRSPVEQSPCQMATQQTGPPVQPRPRQVMTQPSSPTIQQGLHHAAAPREARLIQPKCLTARLSDTSKVLPPSTPASSPVLGEAKILVPSNSEALEQQQSPGQYFTAVHTSVCNIISYAVSASSLEQLQEWLKKTESHAEPKEKGVSLAKHKNGLKASSDLPKLSKGKQIWLAFQDVATLFRKVLSELDTFLLTRKCPFPHVVRAGAIFIPIHVVKEKLFPNLSGTSIDHILQDHKVELRPTTLSEEKLLRDVELRSCTSRMLKLLALKQLPDIYPDLLTLHWHECVKQQLDDYQQLYFFQVQVHRLTCMLPSDTSGETPNSERNTSGAEGMKLQIGATCLQKRSLPSLGQNVQEHRKQGGKCGSAPQDTSTCLHSETGQQADKGSSQGRILSLLEKGTAMKNANWPSEKKRTVSGALKAKGLHPGAKRQLLPTGNLSQTLQVKLTSSVPRKTTSTSKVLQLRKSVVRIKFQNALRDIKESPGFNTAEKKGGKMVSQFLKSVECHRYRGMRASALPLRYPELVGKRIRHLYEEKDKSEAWYRGVVLRVHKRHKDPLKTVYEVKYDSEPDWQYYLEILQDYKKGWLKLDE